MPANEPQQHTHTTLLDRLRDPRDTDAWRTFQATYFDLIVRYARHAGLSHADAEDVAQAVLVGFVKAIPVFRYDRAKGRFRSYLGRCTRNAVTRWKKCPSSARVVLLSDDGAMPPASGAAGDEPDAAWESEWVSFHYRRALASVRQRCDARAVEVLESYSRGLSTRQIAESCSMSEDAVQKTLQRMRTRLAEQIAAQLKEEDDAES